MRICACGYVHVGMCMWVCARGYVHVGGRLCSALTRTRLSQGKVCKEQRPEDGPKTRIFVAEFESAAALLSAHPSATLV